MSGTGTFEIQNDENEDIYKDIGDFHFDKELTKLEECNKAYSEDIERLSANVKQLTARNTELQNVNDILVTNISILLKTAKAEIHRKQLVIDEFRKKIESMNRKNCFKEEEDVKNSVLCNICGSRLSKDNKSDLEDGEVVKSNSEDDIRSEIGSNRNFKGKDKREHSGNHKKKKQSCERSRGRSSDKYSSNSHRISRRSEDGRSHRSRSSRSRPRYNSPDERRHSDRRRRSRERTKHSSDFVCRSSSQKRVHVPHGKEIVRRSEERQRSGRSKVSDSYRKENSLERKSSVRNDKNSDNTASSSRSAGASENKTKCLKPDIDVTKNRTEEKENGKTESQNKGTSEEVKKLNVNEYHERKNINSNSNTVVKECENTLFTRQSVLADLYDETIFSSTFPYSKPKNSEIISECGNQADNRVVNCADSSSDESWSLSFGKKPQVSKKPTTLYSRRMEMKLKQKLKKEEVTSKVSDEGEYDGKNSEKQEKSLEERGGCVEEREEGGITFEEDKKGQIVQDVVLKDEFSEKMEEAPIADENNQTREKHFDDKICTNDDLETETSEHTITDKYREQSLGQNVIKKLLQLQNQEETSGIKEFSPLKNNYKLSKISPLKSVQKQHILDYYNLKPAQQLNNIEPEILDFSFSVPETPGKSFLNPFGALDNQEQRENEDHKLKTFDEEQSRANLNGNKESEGHKETHSSSVEVEETSEGSKSDLHEIGTSSESKQLKRSKAKRKLRPSAAKGKRTDNTKVTPKNKKNKDPVAYQIRTRSKAGNENRKCTSEVNNLDAKRGNASNKNKPMSAKRKRELVSSEEEEEKEEKEQQKNNKRKKASVTEKEMGNNSNEEQVDKEIGNEKRLDASKAEETSKADDITYFEVFQSVSETVNDVTVEEKTTLDELSLSNMSDCRATSTSCSDTPNKLKYLNESKMSLLSVGNSGDSSTFKVLRSYLMLSAYEESDVEVLSEDSTCNSGEYSDSGASAFVDLL